MSYVVSGAVNALIVYSWRSATCAKRGKSTLKLELFDKTGVIMHY